MSATRQAAGGRCSTPFTPTPTNNSRQVRGGRGGRGAQASSFLGHGNGSPVGAVTRHRRLEGALRRRRRRPAVGVPRSRSLSTGTDAFDLALALGHLTYARRFLVEASHHFEAAVNRAQTALKESVDGLGSSRRPLRARCCTLLLLPDRVDEGTADLRRTRVHPAGPILDLSDSAGVARGKAGLTMNRSVYESTPTGSGRRRARRWRGG